MIKKSMPSQQTIPALSQFKKHHQATLRTCIVAGPGGTSQ